MKKIDKVKNKWKKYTGKYEKEFYDIKTKSGEIYRKCWPNAGYFHSYEGEMIKEDDIDDIIESKMPQFNKPPPGIEFVKIKKCKGGWICPKCGKINQSIYSWCECATGKRRRRGEEKK